MLSSTLHFSYSFSLFVLIFVFFPSISFFFSFLFLANLQNKNYFFFFPSANHFFLRANWWHCDIDFRNFPRRTVFQSVQFVRQRAIYWWRGSGMVLRGRRGVYWRRNENWMEIGDGKLTHNSPRVFFFCRGSFIQWGKLCHCVLFLGIEITKKL